MNTANIIEQLEDAIELQILILKAIRERQLNTVVRIAEAIVSAASIVTTGVGKSGFIAQKLSASLVSLGINARYLHPTDALHGDIGVPPLKSILVVFSKSGTTAELRSLIKLRQIQEKFTIVAITADSNSWLASEAEHVLSITTNNEYDENNLLPTASTTTSLALSDLLVATVAHKIDNAERILGITHPHGSIGRLLLSSVSSVMTTGSALPLVDYRVDLKAAIDTLNRKSLGIVCGVDSNNNLMGILTDGDVRRLVSNDVDVAALTFDKVATTNPITVHPSATLHEALMLMESGARKVMVLPVAVDGDQIIGVVRMHDIVSQQIAQ